MTINAADAFKQAMRYTQVAFTFTVSIAVCAAGGYWLDNKIGGGNLVFLAGIGLGFAAGTYYLIRELAGGKGGDKPGGKAEEKK